MNHPTLPKSFIFNEKINSDYLFSLYTDDYPYMEEVFAVTLKHFDPDFEAIQVAYAMDNVTDLKRAIHKVKPAFGFVGLTDIQQQCKEFEDLCEKASATEDVKNNYKQLVVSLEEGKNIIEAEYRRLKDYNADPL